MTACCAVFALLLPAPAQGDEVVQPWEVLGDNLAEIYGWPMVLFHVSAVALTPPVMIAIDEPLQEALQQDDPVSDPYGEASAAIGLFTPIVVPALVYGVGAAGGDAELATAGAAAIQAVLVQFVVVSTLKWLTDRAGPFPDGDPEQERWHGGTLRDSEHADDWNFNPFDLTWGLRWPSGHTASNVALVSALVAFYPKELWIAVLGYPLALAIGFGMVEGDYHWLSDIVAGALIGHAIGWSIGRGFRSRFDARNRGQSRARGGVQVEVIPTPLGLRIAGWF